LIHSVAVCGSFSSDNSSAILFASVDPEGRRSGNKLSHGENIRREHPKVLSIILRYWKHYLRSFS